MARASGPTGERARVPELGYIDPRRHRLSPRPLRGARPVDLMEIAAAIPTTPQANQPQHLDAKWISVSPIQPVQSVTPQSACTVGAPIFPVTGTRSRDDKLGYNYTPGLRNRGLRNRGSRSRTVGYIGYNSTDSRSNTGGGYTTIPRQGQHNRSPGRHPHTVLSPNSMEVPVRTGSRQRGSGFLPG